MTPYSNSNVLQWVSLTKCEKSVILSGAFIKYFKTDPSCVADNSMFKMCFRHVCCICIMLLNQKYFFNHFSICKMLF